jgi:UDP-N-acetylmuramyl pentapeptide phosphotransferase/UDP-N-acetylglucosamine-1-phosphate transferase
MSSVIAGLLTAVLTALASAAAILLLYPVLKRYALAKPNARSSHLTPTPQGAGIAVIAAVVAASAIAIALHAFPEGATLPLTIIVAAALAMACVGAIDDIRPLPIVPRLLLQAVIVAAVIYSLPKELRIVPVVPWSLERLILLLGGLWFVNLVNFMDGIDWMTAAEVIPLTATFALLGAAHALPSYGAFLAAGARRRRRWICLFQSPDRQSFSRRCRQPADRFAARLAPGFTCRKRPFGRRYPDAALLSCRRHRYAVAPADPQ